MVTTSVWHLLMHGSAEAPRLWIGVSSLVGCLGDPLPRYSVLEHHRHSQHALHRFVRVVKNFCGSVLPRPPLLAELRQVFGLVIEVL